MPRITLNLRDDDSGGRTGTIGPGSRSTMDLLTIQTLAHGQPIPKACRYRHVELLLRLSLPWAKMNRLGIVLVAGESCWIEALGVRLSDVVQVLGASSGLLTQGCEALLHKGSLPVNTIGPKVWLTPGAISVAVDRLEKKELVKRKHTDDRRVRLVELTANGRALITKTFRKHAAAMEGVAGVLSKEERLMLLRLLKKLGKGGADGP